MAAGKVMFPDSVPVSWPTNRGGCFATFSYWAHIKSQAGWLKQRKHIGNVSSQSSGSQKCEDPGAATLGSF